MLRFIRGLLIRLAILSGLVLIFLLFKGPILRGLGNHLIKEDTLQPVEVAFVLSGLHTERVPYALQQLEEELTPKIVITGANVDPDLEAIGLNLADAESGMRYALSLGADTSQVMLLAEGTSTMEEAQAILTLAKVEGWEKIMVISSAFHTRRLHMVFKDLFEQEGIQTVIRGAPPKAYSLEEWWDTEQGLIFVNNEYVKLVYYWFKY